MTLGNYSEMKKHKNFDITMEEIARLQKAGIKFSQITLGSKMGYLTVAVQGAWNE